MLMYKIIMYLYCIMEFPFPKNISKTNFRQSDFNYDKNITLNDARKTFMQKGGNLNLDNTILTNLVNTANNNISTSNANITTLQDKTVNISQANNKTVITGNLDTNGCDIGSFASNSIMGKNCGYSLTSGTANSIYAMESAKSITSGSKNCIFGTWASNAITTSYYNCAFGYGADANNGSTAIGSQSNALGTGSTSIGRMAGSGATGSNCSYIGANSGINSTGSNKIFLGDGNITGVIQQVASTILSDARDKLDIQDLPFDALQYITMLQPKIYRMNPRKRYLHVCDDDDEGCCNSNMDINDESKSDEDFSIGLIAQDIEIIEDALPITNNMILDNIDSETLAIKYSAIIPILIDAIKTLTNRVEELENI